MRNYLLRRIGQSLFLSLFISFIIYMILSFVPGGPFDLLPLQNPKITPSHIQRLNALLGLDKPIHMRYIGWLVGDDWIEALPTWFAGTDKQGQPFKNGDHKGILRGDWGDSWTFRAGQSVSGLILEKIRFTLMLSLVSTFFAVGIGIPIGIFSAVRQYSFADYIVTALAFLGQSMPTFWLGIMAIIIFSVTLGWFPTGGVASSGTAGNLLDVICNVLSFGDRISIGCRDLPASEWGAVTADGLAHLALPAFILAIFSMASWSRYSRSSMLEVLRQDYLRTARAKGVRESAVILKHALRNALIPIITILGLDIPALVGGAIITETIFGWPGMGRLFFDSLSQVDWPVVQGILVMIAVIIIFSNLLADVLYAVVDPRIQYS